MTGQSRAQQFAGTARGRQAASQQELVKMAKGPGGLKEAYVEHPTTQVGFIQEVDGQPVRMNYEAFRRTIATLFKVYPTARVWDIYPTDAAYSETCIMEKAPEGFRMTMDNKAELLADEFRSRPLMSGFRLELHNISSQTGEKSPAGPPSMSLYVYDLDTDPEGFLVPVTIKVNYRPNF